MQAHSYMKLFWQFCRLLRHILALEYVMQDFIEFECEGFFIPIISVEEMDVEYIVAAPAPVSFPAEWLESDYE